MRSISLASLVAATLALSSLPTAQAQDISYSYADLGYVTTDLDGIGKDLDGLFLRGSLEVVDNVFVYARYVDQSVEFRGFDIDTQQLGVGAGYAWSFAENMDLYGKVGYVSAEADAGGGMDVDDDGYELGVGLRARPVDPLELEANVTYVDLSDSGDDTALGVGARWYIAPQFALGVEGEFADDADSYGIGFRWAFGNK